MIPQVGVLMGSDSDLPVLQDAFRMLEKMNIHYEALVISAHRTPGRAVDYATKAAGRGIKVIIAAAGGAAHLAGVLAAHTTLPVIGIPVAGGALGGVDALYSTVQMPPGVPVATVAINGAVNAALLAAEIIGLGEPEVGEALARYRQELARSVENKSEKLAAAGPFAYMNSEK